METDDAANPYAAPASPAETDDGAIGPLPEGPYGPFRDNRVLSRWVVGLVLATALPDVFWGVIEVLRAHAPARFGYGSPIIAPAIDALGYFSLANLATFAVFGVWIVRAAKNAWLFRNVNFSAGPPLTTTPGWAVGWYFIPIVNLWKPYVAMREIARASTTRTAPPGSLLPLWWTLWLLSSFAGIASTNVANMSGALGQAVLFSTPHAINIALSLVACQLVRAITLLQTDSAKHFAAMDPAEIAPAWIHENAPKVARARPVES